MADAKHTTTPREDDFAKASQRPWSYHNNPRAGVMGRDWIEDANGSVILENLGWIDGPLIVTAVNERQALLKCEEALKIARHEMVRTGFTDFGVKFIDDALKSLDEARNGK